MAAVASIVGPGCQRGPRLHLHVHGSNQAAFRATSQTMGSASLHCSKLPQVNKSQAST